MAESDWANGAVLIMNLGVNKKDTFFTMKDRLKKYTRRFDAFSDRAVSYMSVRALTIYAAARSMKYPAEYLTSRETLQKMFSIEHKGKMMSEKKQKLVDTRNAVVGSRAHGEVFYMISGHQKPADGHRDYQYTLCVDRYWRSVLDDEDEMIVKAVSKYIRDNNLPSMQHLMLHDPYIVTRPNCKHRFVPISINEVLSKTRAEIAATHPEVHDHSHRSLSDKQRYVKKVARMNKIKNSLKLKR